MTNRKLFSRFRQFGSVLVISGLLLGLAACGSNKADSNSSQQESGSAFRQDTAVVETAEVQGRDFQRSLQATGTLVARERAELRTQVEGNVTKVNVDIGDYVHKGQKLLQIRQVDYKLALEQAEANLSRAQATYNNAKQERDRIKNLYQAGSATSQQNDQTESAYEQAVAGLKQARAARDNAKQKLDDTVINAPYSGFITKRSFLAGDFARIGDPAFEITDLSVLEAEMDVPERYAGSIPKGLPVMISFQASFKPLQGKVSAVNPSIDTQTRTFTVKVTVDNNKFTVPAGMFCTANFNLPVMKNQPSVPKDAINQQEGRSIVWIISGGKAHEQEVTEGVTDGDWVMIDNGVKIGDTVAVSGTSILIDGYPVHVKKNDETAMR